MKNKDKEFLDSLDDLYKMYQGINAAEYDIDQDKEVLNYFEDYESDDAYAQEILQDKNQDLIDKAETLESEVKNSQEDLDKSKKDHLNFITSAEKSKRVNFISKIVAIACAVFVIITFCVPGASTAILGSFDRAKAQELGFTIAYDEDGNMYYHSDMSEEETAIKNNELMEYSTGVRSTILTIIGICFVVSIILFIVTFVSGAGKSEAKRGIKEETQRQKDLNEKLDSDNKELIEVKAVTLDKINEYKGHRSEMMGLLNDSIPKKEEAYNGMLANLRDFYATNDNFPDERDIYKIPMIIDYWKRGYVDNMKEALVFCREEERHEEVMNTFRSGINKLCLELNSISNSLDQGFNTLSIQLSNVDSSIQQQIEATREAAESMNEIKAINQQMAASAEKCAEDTEVLRKYCAYKNQGASKNKIHRELFRGDI